MLLALALACAPAPAPPPADLLTVTDLAGRSVQVPATPQRLVASGPGALRMVVYLGATDRVVGVEASEARRVTPYGLAHPELRELPVIGAGGPTNIGSGPDPEATLQVGPDLIVLTYTEPDLADRLQERLGVPVLVLSEGPLGGVDERLDQSLGVLGEVLGLEERAAAVSAFTASERAALAERAGEPVEGVYVGGVAFKGFQGLESTTVRYLPLELLGQPHLAQQLDGAGLFRTVDPEQLLAWQPRVVLLDASASEAVAAERTAHPGVFAELDAFREGHVHTLLPYNTYSTNLGVALADAWTAGAVLRPEAFAGVDPAAETDRITEALVGAPVFAELVDAYGAPGTWAP